MVWLGLGSGAGGGADLGDCGRRWKPGGCLVPRAGQRCVAGTGWTRLSECGTTLLLSALLGKLMAVSSR